jgi:hypothetical protein
VGVTVGTELAVGVGEGEGIGVAVDWGFWFCV